MAGAASRAVWTSLVNRATSFVAPAASVWADCRDARSCCVTCWCASSARCKSASCVRSRPASASPRCIRDAFSCSTSCTRTACCCDSSLAASASCFALCSSDSSRATACRSVSSRCPASCSASCTRPACCCVSELSRSSSALVGAVACSMLCSCACSCITFACSSAELCCAACSAACSCATWPCSWSTSARAALRACTISARSDSRRAPTVLGSSLGGAPLTAGLGRPVDGGSFRATAGPVGGSPEAPSGALGDEDGASLRRSAAESRGLLPACF